MTIMRNSVANAIGVGCSAVMQIISVPILVSVWGMHSYGTWLMLTTIPTYFALTDLGFASAATSDMTMAIASGNRDGAVKTFQSVWLLVVLVGLFAVTMSGFVLGLISLSAEVSSIYEYHDVVIVLVVYSSLLLTSRIILAGFRSTGNYALGTMIYDVLAAIEGLVVIGFAWMYKSFLVCSLAFVGARLVIIFVQALVLRNVAPWLPLGFHGARLSELRRLFRPAIGALAIPSVLAVNIQGIVMITGMVISPSAVAILSPVRTASRIALQLVGIVNRATMPSFSVALAKTDRVQLVGLLKLNALVILAILVPGTVAFSLFGGYFVNFWTGGAISPGQPFVAFMALAMLLQGLWSLGVNLLLAINQHVRFAVILVPASVVSVVLAGLLGMRWGLSGVAFALVVSEALSFVGLVIVSSSLFRKILTPN